MPAPLTLWEARNDPKHVIIKMGGGNTLEHSSRYVRYLLIFGGAEQYNRIERIEKKNPQAQPRASYGAPQDAPQHQFFMSRGFWPS